MHWRGDERGKAAVSPRSAPALRGTTQHVSTTEQIVPSLEGAWSTVEKRRKHRKRRQQISLSAGKGAGARHETRLVGARVSSHGVAEKFISLLSVPKYFANINNDWGDRFGSYITLRLIPYSVQDNKAQDAAAHDLTPARAVLVPWPA